MKRINASGVPLNPGGTRGEIARSTLPETIISCVPSMTKSLMMGASGLSSLEAQESAISKQSRILLPPGIREAQHLHYLSQGHERLARPQALDRPHHLVQVGRLVENPCGPTLDRLGDLSAL